MCCYIKKHVKTMKRVCMMLSTELTVKTQERDISIIVSEIYSKRMNGNVQKLQ